MSLTFETWNIVNIVNSGESACTFYFGGQTLQQQNEHVQRFTQALLYSRPDWIVEIVPSFDSVMVCFNPVESDQYCLFEWITTLPLFDMDALNSAHHTIKVCYDRQKQFDLQAVADVLGCSISDVINTHVAKTYTAFAVGFSPGFAYLGETHQSIHLPRLTRPRTKVPKGAIALADSYTAVYPDESPGGWNLIGMLAGNQASMFERNIQVGDTVNFIDSNEE